MFGIFISYYLYSKKSNLKFLFMVLKNYFHYCKPSSNCNCFSVIMINYHSIFNNQYKIDLYLSDENCSQSSKIQTFYVLVGFILLIFNIMYAVYKYFFRNY